MGLLSGLVVQGVRRSVPTLTARAVGSAAGQAIGQAAGQAIGRGVAGSVAPTPLTPTQLDGVTVEGQAPPEAPEASDLGDLSGAGAQALANIGGQAAMNGGGDAGNEVSALTVEGQGSPQAAAPLLNLSGSGTAFAQALGQSGGQQLAQAMPLANIQPTDVDGLTVTGLSRQDNSPYDAIAPALVATNVPDLQTMRDRVGDDPLKKDGNGGLLAAGAAGLGALGLSMKDLLGLGLLGAGLMGGAASLNSGGDPNKPGTPAAELTNIAKGNQQLANQLAGRAQAGMSGDIGGKGMNYIARMVREAQAAIRQKYASMGMSGSTAETQDLNAAAQSGVDMQFKVGQEQAQMGLATIAALTGQSANVYAALLNAQTQKDTALGNALANFAGAAAGALLT